MNNKYLTLVTAVSLLLAGLSAHGEAINDSVRGIPKPKICLESNIRCILKQQGDTIYWCLKSSIQRNLDTEHNAHPITKSLKGNMGNCAKIVPVNDYPTE
ncbi:MAG: hypothetical protein A2508_04650 [Candidatus Lambdaproteobacteria bacterium RIFOXYD12_FULL_49_8]|uniref:Uncharacterized protein n=1 Tax=Candidatus Lambdaproteobacteria bacterium RIFOXYD2_FULL_50_16 TaxID=1817772 RepID=A0A1F6GBP8_9PROT|nr:MAG: hypothetical protein A2527_06880 [Candidatus Lambdaproteobacteria bacterium RIFOXYD2_FULL_50_16]OGG97582.1 MAG: hypothetical protein A2508_04650 [Candidatus Lambdaproteobacteria bacterium RIFOXYD12_FULL_49_8]